MGWNAEELPVAALEARLARLRVAMQSAGLDAFVLYTNNTRPSAVHYMTGFTPYWSDALLLVGRDGAPVFATALSKRVSEWIRTTDPVSEIANTPRPGSLIGERMAKAGVKHAGVLEFDALPAGLADELAEAAPRVEWTDGTALFAGLRREPDDPERKLLARADAIAAAALGEAGKAQDAGTLAGLVERSARLAGAEEAYIAIAPDLGAERRLNRTSQPTPLAHRFAVRASIAYKGCWVRRTRTFARMAARPKPLRGSMMSCARLKPASRWRRSLRPASRSCRVRASKAGSPKAASAALRFRPSHRRVHRARMPRTMASSWC
jgi:hypothetical protein